jgi:hypothetical protein
MDWQALTALCAAFTVGGGALGWFGRILYRRGGVDRAIRENNLVAAASIGRLEIAVEKLSGAVHDHITDDAGKFGQLFTMATAANNTMNSAAEEMRELTRRMDRAFEAARS